MFYAITAILSEGAEAKLETLQAEFNEHLSQPFRKLKLAGPLCDPAGNRKGYMVVIEAGGFAEAEAYLKESPIFRAGLYERAELFEYQIQLGSLG